MICLVRLPHTVCNNKEKKENKIRSHKKQYFFWFSNPPNRAKKYYKSDLSKYLIYLYLAKL